MAREGGILSREGSTTGSLQAHLYRRRVHWGAGGRHSLQGGVRYGSLKPVLVSFVRRHSIQRGVHYGKPKIHLYRRRVLVLVSSGGREGGIPSREGSTTGSLKSICGVGGRHSIQGGGKPKAHLHRRRVLCGAGGR